MLILTPAREFGGAVSSLALALYFNSATISSGAPTVDTPSGATMTFSDTDTVATKNYWDADGVLTTVSAVDTARLTYEPTTNLLVYPEQFDNAEWTNTNTTESSGQADPLGGTDAFSIVENDTAAGSTHSIETTTGINVEAKAYTASVYAKAGARNWLKIGFGTAAGYAFFNLSTGVVGTKSAVDGAGIAAVDGQAGWYRCWVTETLASGTDKVVFTLGEADNDSSYDGDGSSNIILAFAQLNEGGIKPYVGCTNLLSNDKDVTTGWTNTNTTDAANVGVAPDGASTADRLDITAGAGIHDVYQAETTTASTDYTASAFFKDDGEGFAGVHFGDLTGTNYIAIIANLADQTTTTSTGSGSGTITASGATYWGNGWTEVWITGQVDSTANSVSLFGSDVASPTYSNGRATFTGVAGNDLLVWGAQLVAGSKQPYIGMPSTSFRRRSTADASAKAGVLIEAAATNLVADSEDITNTSWNYDGQSGDCIRTANQAIAPDGTLTADKIASDGVDPANSGYVGDAEAGLSAPYVASVFAKAEEHQYLVMTVGSFAGGYYAIFDLLAGTIATAPTDAETTAGMERYANGWHRCWLTISDANGLEVIIFCSSPANDITTVGTNGEGIYVWGAQLETGDYPSSYVKTSGGTTTRSADDLSMTGTDFSDWWNDDEGTFIVDAVMPNKAVDSTYPIVVEASNNTWQNTVHIEREAWSNHVNMRVYSASTLVADLDATGVGTGGARFKAAGVHKLNDFALYADGTQVDTDAAGAVPVSPSQLNVGAYHTGAPYWDSTIRSIEFHNTRRDNTTLASDSTISDDGL